MRIQTALLILGAAPLSAMAAGPSFTYATASFLQSDAPTSSGNDASGDGYGLELSYQLPQTYWGMQPVGMLDYSTRKFDSAAGSLEMGLISVGAGVSYALARNVSVFGGLTYESLDSDATVAEPAAAKACLLDPLPCFPIIDDEGDAGEDPAAGEGESRSANGGNDSDSGIGAKVGVKSLFYDMFEASATYSYRDYDFDAESVLGVGAAVLWKQMAFTLNYETYDKLDLDEIRVGARYDFF